MPSATSRIDLPARSGSANAVCAGRSAMAASGIATSNVEPAPGSLSSAMRPPMRLTMRSRIARPSPVPPYLRATPLVGLLEFAEDAALCLGRDADAGVAHQET